VKWCPQDALQPRTRDESHTLKKVEVQESHDRHKRGESSSKKLASIKPQSPFYLTVAFEEYLHQKVKLTFEETVIC
jgi:hypothetical protein